VVAIGTMTGLVMTREPTKTLGAQTPAPSAAPEKPAPQLHGRILDADGEVVAHAHVRLVEQSHITAETDADARGEYAFASVGGPLRVEAEHDPQGEVRSDELTLVAGHTTELTLVLGPASVRGLVVDADDGHPIGGASLTITGAIWSVAPTVSDQAGTFRLALVPFEATAIAVAADGYKLARAPLGQREGKPEPALRIELHRGPPADGDVLDPDGKPVRARVVACEGQASEARVESAVDGTFRLPTSAVGCDAVALHDELAPSDAVRIVEGRRTTLRLAAGGSITGTVVDDRGALIDAFSVGVESLVEPHGSGHRSGVSPFKGGAFRLERLIPGTYVLTASTVGRPPARSDPIVVRAASVTAGVRIVLVQGGSIVGRVFDERHNPVADVDLHYDLVSSVAESSAATKTDGLGRYHLDEAPSGLFTLRAQKDGFRVKLLSGLSVPSGQTLTKDVMLTTVDGGGGLELGGIGANLAPQGAGIVVASVFPGDPADRAGLRAADRIVSIDGEEAAGLSVAMAIQRLRGEPGTTAFVSVLRNGEPVDVMMVRSALVR
jgi:hypothetical protein